ncbi:MAG: MFS transporter [Pseudomonadota bacterium]
MLAFQKHKTPLFYGVLSLPSTAMGFALSVQIAALSWLLTTQYQLDIYDVGLVWAAGPLTGIFGQVIIGGLSDKAWFWGGRRRPFILIGGALAALSLLALPQIGVISSAMGFESVVGIALIVVLTLDFSINVGFNPTRSVIADVTDEGAERIKGYTWMQTVSGSLGVGAYAIGAIFGNMTLIYVGVIGVFLMACLPPLFIEEPRDIATSDEEESSKSPLELLLSIKPLWGFLAYSLYSISLKIAGITVDNFYAEIVFGALTIFLVAQTLMKKIDDDDTSGMGQFQKVLAAHSFSWIGIHTTFVYMTIFVQQYFPALSADDSGRVTSLSFLILNAVGALLPLFVLGPLSHRFGKVKAHSGALFVMAAGYVVTYFYGNTLVSVYFLMAVIGVGWASIVSLPFAIMSQKVDSKQMGMFMGLFNLSVVLPQLTVSLGVAALISRIDDKGSIWMISAIAILLSAIAWLRVEDEVQTVGDEQPLPAGGGGH